MALEYTHCHRNVFTYLNPEIFLQHVSPSHTPGVNSTTVKLCRTSPVADVVSEKRSCAH